METFRTMESFMTQGTCSKQIIFKVSENVLTECRFVNGCSGNLQAISKMSVGRHIDEIIEKFKDIKCRNNTSCPAQLAAALRQYKVNREAAAVQQQAAQAAAGAK